MLEIPTQMNDAITGISIPEVMLFIKKSKRNTSKIKTKDYLKEYK
jgi:hypothetical protein